MKLVLFEGKKRVERGARRQKFKRKKRKQK
jgi:hypothetical protein